MSVDDRYSRQIILENIQEAGQKKLSKNHVVVIGCGALGTTIANNLARSGVGHIKIVDRDIVELNNLQRQILFDEDDIGLPKASIVAQKLKRINSGIKIDFVIDDVTHKNIENIIKDMDIVVDGTDNMLIRFLINDACIKNGIPWVYGGAIETHGMTMNIIPHKTPCFRCIVQDLPEAGSLPTCDTVGVLMSIPSIIGSIQSTETLKIILNKQINRDLLVYDVWSHDFHRIKIKRKKDCECCVKHNFEFLNAEKKEEMISICGSGAIQVTPVKTIDISFEELAKKLQKLGDVENRKVILRFRISGYELNIFRNGRTIIIGTNDMKTAKSLYAKYVGI
ncbi:MAG: ThiF family adenylyltransferase [Thermoplasmatales archaeon]|nr:MAG: ThiF family adenylyltransferase [Thermoplasmatales archaeon]